MEKNYKESDLEKYVDVELVCMCGTSFVWERGEQAFINQLKDSGKITSVQIPKRCPTCRQKKRELRNSQK